MWHQFMKSVTIKLKYDFREFSKEIQKMAMLYVNAVAMKYLEMGYIPVLKDNGHVDEREMQNRSA